MSEPYRRRRRPGDDDIDEPMRLGASLDAVVRSLGPGLSTRSLDGVFGRWEEIVGLQVAGNARPVSLTNGRLVVAVDQPGWATQLRYLEKDLLARIAAMVGDGAVTAIEVRVQRAR